jgi:PBP1b-binding outer membrane lipoprotein LpoB
MYMEKKIILILLIPILLTGCARAQGALAPSAVPASSEGFAPIDQTDKAYLPDVEPAALAPIINYVDGLNLALTGEFLYLKSTAISSCDCLAIADRLARLFKTASLVGGSYQLKSIELSKAGANQKSFTVVINRSDIRKVDRASRQSTLWSGSIIKNTFTVKRVGGEWLLSDIL